MSLRTRLSFLLPALTLVFAPARAEVPSVPPPARAELPESGDSSPAAEAKRLYDHANDYVSGIKEGDYSYSYLQFYWKRSESYIERVQRLYPDTPTGHALKAGQEKLGTFDLTYFRDRVLFRLEEKSQASVDQIKCAIFLCELKGETWDDNRRIAVMRIIEVLSRQKRWGEAVKFPVLPADEFLKTETIFRVAARYEQDDLVKDFLAKTPMPNLRRLHAIYGEALALRGLPRASIKSLLDQDSADEVKLAVLSGMAQREAKIRLAATLRLPENSIVLVGETLKRPDVRDNVVAVAPAFFPNGNAASTEILAVYRAHLGERPPNAAATPVHLAYLEYLAAAEKFDELTNYLLNPLPGESRAGCELKVIELLAQSGRMQDSERYRAPYARAGGALADAATLAQFRGQMNSADAPLTVFEKTLAQLPFKDSAMLAQAIMEWSLTPNRSIRGAAPYDAVVFKYAGGFENIPAPKSKAVSDAASASKPY